MVIDVNLDVAPPTVDLTEPGDTKRFHVAVRGAGTTDDLGNALSAAGAGRVYGDGDAFITIDWVRSTAAGHVDETWDDQFEGMLGYARTKGWLDEAGTAIQAHIEWP